MRPYFNIDPVEPGAERSLRQRNKDKLPAEKAAESTSDELVGCSSSGENVKQKKRHASVLLEMVSEMLDVPSPHSVRSSSSEDSHLEDTIATLAKHVIPRFFRDSDEVVSQSKTSPCSSVQIQQHLQERLLSLWQMLQPPPVDLLLRQTSGIPRLEKIQKFLVFWVVQELEKPGQDHLLRCLLSPHHMRKAPPNDLGPQLRRVEARSPRPGPSGVVPLSRSFTQIRLHVGKAFPTCKENSCINHAQAPCGIALPRLASPAPVNIHQARPPMSGKEAADDIAGNKRVQEVLAVESVGPADDDAAHPLAWLHMRDNSVAESSLHLHEGLCCEGPDGLQDVALNTDEWGQIQLGFRNPLRARLLRVLLDRSPRRQHATRKAPAEGLECLLRERRLVLEAFPLLHALAAYLGLERATAPLLDLVHKLGR